MSSGVTVTGGPLNQALRQDGGRSGASAILVANGDGARLAYINVAFLKEGEYLQLFDSSVAPVVDDKPVLVIGPLSKGLDGYRNFRPGGIYFEGGISYGVSSSVGQFAATAVADQYSITFGIYVNP